MTNDLSFEMNADVEQNERAGCKGQNQADPFSPYFQSM
jgi:hypothetical protein